MTSDTSGARLAIREARPSDVALILRLIRELADYERLADQVQADERRIADALFGPGPRAAAIVGEADGAVVGFALYFFNFSTFVGKSGLYLEDIFVRPAHRGRGYGSAMFRWLARHAVERGCGRMEWAVLDWNAPAIEFYRALGAVALDEWTVYRLDGAGLAKLTGGDAPGCAD